MRLFKSSSVYPQYIDQFYRAYPEILKADFLSQIDGILRDSFSFGDAWKHYLQRERGDEVMEVVLNAEPTQKQWAMEHGLGPLGTDWSAKILTAQLRTFQPSVWFCHSWLDADLRVHLRNLCPSIRCVVGYDGALNNDPQRLRGCDIVLSCSPESVLFYTNAGFRAYLMPWGFDGRRLAHLQRGRECFEISFCGSMAIQAGISHFDRVRLLDHLHQDYNVSIFSGDLTRWRAERNLLSHVRRGAYRLAWQTLRVYPMIRRLRRQVQAERFGLGMLQTLADSRIALNIHGNGTKYAANIRLFEATGVGSCLLTDWKPNLKSLFELDQEVIAFRSSEECSEKIDYLLNHPRERRAIAEAGQKRCLSNHNIGAHILTFASEVLDKI